MFITIYNVSVELFKEYVTFHQTSMTCLFCMLYKSFGPTMAVVGGWGGGGGWVLLKGNSSLQDRFYNSFKFDTLLRNLMSAMGVPFH